MARLPVPKSKSSCASEASARTCGRQLFLGVGGSGRSPLECTTFEIRVVTRAIAVESCWGSSGGGIAIQSSKYDQRALFLNSTSAARRSMLGGKGDGGWALSVFSVLADPGGLRANVFFGAAMHAAIAGERADRG